jgi:hypothetical protein
MELEEFQSSLSDNNKVRREKREKRKERREKQARKQERKNLGLGGVISERKNSS